MKLLKNWRKNRRSKKNAKAAIYRAGELYLKLKQCEYMKRTAKTSLDRQKLQKERNVLIAQLDSLMRNFEFKRLK